MHSYNTHIKVTTQVFWGMTPCQCELFVVFLKDHSPFITVAKQSNKSILLRLLDHEVERTTVHWKRRTITGGEGSASRPGRSLPPGKTQYPLYRRLGGPKGRSGQVQKISPPPGFDPWTVQPVKCTLVQALRLCTGHTAHGGSRGIALPFLDHGTRWG